MGVSATRVAARAALLGREAGLFEAPPAMLRDIGAWMVESYAGHVLANALPLLERVQDASAVFKKGLASNESTRAALASAANLSVGEFIKFPVHDVTFSGQYKIEQWGIKRLEDGVLRERSEDRSIVPRYVIGYGEKAVSWKPSRAPLSYEFSGPVTLDAAQRGVLSALSKVDERLRGQVAHPRIIEGMPDLVEISLLVRELRSYTSKAKVYATSTKHVFPIDLSGWKYVRPGDPTPTEVGFDSLTAILDFKGTQYKGGHWSVKSRELMVEIGKGSTSRYIRTPEQARTVEEFRYGAAEIQRILRHELQHVGQAVLAALHGLSEDAGIPGRALRSPDYDARGRRLDSLPPPSEQPPADTKIVRHVHSLIDTEFYTRLADEIHRFVKFSRRIPMELRREAVRVWVGAAAERTIRDPSNPDDLLSATQEFFGMLKRHEPQKWRKAVAEFYKGIAEAGIRIPSEPRGEKMGTDLRAADMIPTVDIAREFLERGKLPRGMGMGGKPSWTLDLSGAKYNMKFDPERGVISGTLTMGQSGRDNGYHVNSGSLDEWKRAFGLDWDAFDQALLETAHRRKGEFEAKIGAAFGEDPTRLFTEALGYNTREYEEWVSSGAPDVHVSVGPRVLSDRWDRWVPLDVKIAVPLRRKSPISSTPFKSMSDRELDEVIRELDGEALQEVGSYAHMRNQYRRMSPRQQNERYEQFLEYTGRLRKHASALSLRPDYGTSDAALPRGSVARVASRFLAAGLYVGKYYTAKFSEDLGPIWFLAQEELKNGNARGIKVEWPPGRSVPMKAKMGVVHQSEGYAWTEVSPNDLPAKVQARFSAI